MTYFGHKGRDVAHQVNWGQVSKDFSDRIRGINATREEQRAEIDRKHSQAQQMMQDAPQGEHESLNSFSMRVSGDLQNSLMVAYESMKKGEITPLAFQSFKQNMLDGTKMIFGIVSDHQKNYQEVLQRAAEGQSSGLEIWLQQNLENLSDFSRTGSYVDMATGSVNLAKMEEDGSVSAEGIFNANELSAISKSRYDMFDIDGKAVQYAETLGQQVRAIDIPEGLSFVDSVLQNEDYLAAEGRIISSILTNPFQAASILSDHIGGYSFTRSKEEAGADDSLILIQPDPINPSSGRMVPVISEAQKKVAAEAMEGAIRTKLQYREQAEREMHQQRTYRQPTEGQIRRAGGRRDDVEEVSLLRQIYEGRADTRTALASYGERDASIVRMERTPTALKITRRTKGGLETSTIDYGSGLDMFVQAMVGAAGIGDVSYALAQARKIPSSRGEDTVVWEKTTAPEYVTPLRDTESIRSGKNASLYSEFLSDLSKGTDGGTRRDSRKNDRANTIRALVTSLNRTYGNIGITLGRRGDLVTFTAADKSSVTVDLGAPAADIANDFEVWFNELKN